MRASERQCVYGAAWARTNASRLLSDAYHLTNSAAHPYVTAQADECVRQVLPIPANAENVP
jgi:hypothetical protein